MEIEFVDNIDCSKAEKEPMAVEIGQDTVWGDDTIAMYILIYSIRDIS